MLNTLKYDPEKKWKCRNPDTTPINLKENYFFERRDK